MLIVEAVTVCVGYDDFLAETILTNGQFFKRWVIVTAPNDHATLKLCKKHNMQVLITEDFGRNGDAEYQGRIFNKGRAIQRGLNSLACRHWVLHIDADIALPPEFMHALYSADLEGDKIYGCDRMMVPDWAAWQRIKASGYRQHGQHCYVLAHEKYPIGTRWRSERDGWVPIGFFQLVHGSSLVRDGIWPRPYPDHHCHAARSDVQFGLQWDRKKRELLPELLVWHLESERGEIGRNWNGRKTKRFGPDVPAVAGPGGRSGGSNPAGADDILPADGATWHRHPYYFGP